jgi:hypothetical protein
VFDLVFALFANKWYQSLVRDSIEKKLGFQVPAPSPSFFRRTPRTIQFGDAPYRLLVEFLVRREVPEVESTSGGRASP